MINLEAKPFKMIVKANSFSQIKKRLVVFSSVEHHLTESGIVAHGGFVREIDIWAKIFEKIIVITKRGFGNVLADEVGYSSDNVCLVYLPSPANTNGLFGKIKLAFYIPIWVINSIKQLSASDVIMARGPEAIGFLGWFVTRFRKLPRFAKYVNQWEDYPNEPIGYRIQKKIYRNGNFGGPVMIYSSYDAKRPHLFPFFPIGISRLEWDQIGTQIERRVAPPPYRLLFVGRFVYIKGVDILLDALKILNEKRDDLLVDLVGDGPLRNDIEKKISNDNLTNVRLHGWLSKNDTSHFYSRAHLFIHPSRIEGFGKVLIEAMNYGLPIVGSNLQVSKELVEKDQCGLLFDNGNAIHLAEKIEEILSTKINMQSLGINGRLVSGKFLQEQLEDRYREFIKDRITLT